MNTPSRTTASTTPPTRATSTRITPGSSSSGTNCSARSSPSARTIARVTGSSATSAASISPGPRSTNGSGSRRTSGRRRPGVPDWAMRSANRGGATTAAAIRRRGSGKSGRNASEDQVRGGHVDEADIVVVGGGSGGSAAAGRLSEDGTRTVALLEAGGRNTGLKVVVPGLLALTNPASNWAYETVPQPGLNGRRGYQPRGKGLGGSSAINAMAYIRGNPWDYDNWAAHGLPRLGVGRRAALVQALRRQCARCRRLPRRRRAADGQRPATAACRQPRIHRRRRIAPDPAQRRFQRRRGRKASASIRSRRRTANAGRRRAPISTTRRTAPTSTS